MAMRGAAGAALPLGVSGQRPESSGKVRLQRLLADLGIAARRGAEEMIEEGRVEVNGAVVSRLPVFVDPRQDRVVVDGKPVQRGRPRRLYLMVNKPQRVLVTTGDEPGMGRRTVMDLVDHPGVVAGGGRLYPVGRLDFNTAGLVLLTNDGALANRLTHPRYGIPKTYRAVVRGAVAPADLPAIQRRLAREIGKDDRARGREGSSGGPGGARLELAVAGGDAGRTVLWITVREGRAGNIASMLAAAGVNVRSLERVAIGPLELKGLARGQWRELGRAEVAALKAAARGRVGPERPMKRERARENPGAGGVRSRRRGRRA
jgi:23S rRNA pseudouridine2605 synthase